MVAYNFSTGLTELCQCLLIHIRVILASFSLSRAEKTCNSYRVPDTHTGHMLELQDIYTGHMLRYLHPADV